MSASDERSPGIKVPMGQHSIAGGHVDTTGYSLICSCGWTKRVRFPAYVDRRYAAEDRAAFHADHVRHMTLVHDVQTHSNNACGRLCIYPKVAAGSSR